MSHHYHHHPKEKTDPKLQERIDCSQKRDRRVEHVFRRILHYVELTIAILTHDNPWSNIACTACIAGLFAIRRFLVRRNELKEEMVEIE